MGLWKDAGTSNDGIGGLSVTEGVDEDVEVVDDNDVEVERVVEGGEEDSVVVVVVAEVSTCLST